MGMVSIIVRILVVIVNIIFLLTGVGLFGLGMFVRFGQDYITDDVDSVVTAIETSLTVSGFDTTAINFDVYAILFDISLVLIFLGLLIVAISVFACCGSCYKIKCLLILYVVVCGILLIGQIVNIVLLFAFPNVIRDPLKSQLREDIQSYYMGINGTNTISVVWNVVMRNIECCGVDSYADFTGASMWLVDYTSKTPSVTLKTPICCCSTLPTSDDFSCAGSSATSSQNYMDTGCVNKIWDMIVGSTYTIAILAAVLAFQLILLVLVIVILCSMRNDKKNKVKPTSSSNNNRGNGRNRRNGTQRGTEHGGQRGRGNQGYGKRRRHIV